jgi:hypothetical protein
MEATAGPYREAGAEGVWTADGEGEVRFFAKAVETSEVAAGFPGSV